MTQPSAPVFISRHFDKSQMLPTVAFREMDQMAVESYHLPIENMMEKAGEKMALFVKTLISNASVVSIGVGRGNNGGGGLVAARYLLEDGYRVVLHIPKENLRLLPAKQLKRALKAGAETGWEPHTDIFVDAYLGFSQTLPLSLPYMASVYRAAKFDCPVVSLDLPTGFDIYSGESLFDPDYVLTLAVPKIELFQDYLTSEIYLADIGIPEEIYHYFGLSFYQELQNNGILKINYKKTSYGNSATIRNDKTGFFGYGTAIGN